jgi:hypothetical protein
MLKFLPASYVSFIETCYAPNKTNKGGNTTQGTLFGVYLEPVGRSRIC